MDDPIHTLSALILAMLTKAFPELCVFGHMDPRTKGLGHSLWAQNLSMTRQVEVSPSFLSHQ